MSQILPSNSYVYVTKNSTQGTNKKRSDQLVQQSNIHFKMPFWISQKHFICVSWKPVMQQSKTYLIESKIVQVNFTILSL